MSTAQTIALDGQQALNFVNTMLPIIEQAAPAVGAAAGPIGLGVSAAAAALPLVVDLVNKLSQQGIITPDEQAALDARIEALPDELSGPEWQPRPGEPAQ